MTDKRTPHQQANEFVTLNFSGGASYSALPTFFINDRNRWVLRADFKDQVGNDAAVEIYIPGDAGEDRNVSVHFGSFGSDNAVLFIYESAGEDFSNITEAKAGQLNARIKANGLSTGDFTATFGPGTPTMEGAFQVTVREIPTGVKRLGG